MATELEKQLAEALRDAATSLETVGRLAGKPYYGLDEQGEPIPTYMVHNDEVRGYANSRAGVARQALAAFNAQQAAPSEKCKVCGGAKTVEQFTSAAAPVQRVRCFACKGTGEQAAPSAQPEFDWPKLTSPAKVGAGTFGVGVSARLVVEAAQRQHEYAVAEGRKTPEEAQQAERARRELWDMLNGAPSGQPAQDGRAAFESDKGETNGRNDGLRSALHGRVSLGDRAYGALVDGLFASDDVMSLNAELGLTMDQLVRLVQATHAALASQPAARVAPLTDEQIEQGRRETFSTDNPFCPCTDKTMRKAVRWAERAHGITAPAAQEVK